MDTIKIIGAGEKDLEGISRLLKITWLETYPNEEHGITRADIESRFVEDESEKGKKKQEERKRRFSDPLYYQLVARDGEKYVGMCMVKKEEGYGRVKAIYVHPDYQGKKIGKELMKQGLEWLGEQDVYLNVVTYNQKAIDFYEHMGFRKTGKVIEDAAARLPSGKMLPEIEMMKTNF